MLEGSLTNNDPMTDEHKALLDDARGDAVYEALSTADNKDDAEEVESGRCLLLWGPALCGLAIGILVFLALACQMYPDVIDAEVKPLTFCKAAAFVVLTYFLKVGFSLLRKIWLLALGVDEADVEAVLGPGAPNLRRIFRSVDEYHIRVCDGVVRKSFHIVINVLKMILWSRMLPGKEVVTCTLAIYLSIFGICLCHLRSSSTFAKYAVFMLVRVRDGKWRRWNCVYVDLSVLLGAFFTTLCWRVWIHPAAMVYDQVVGKAILSLIWIPLGIGDAVAELVGSVFGRHEFEVSGLGEINRKTLEGCAGMFFGTWLPSAYVASTSQILNNATTHMFVVLFALIATLVETWTPRGFDNFTITGFSIFMWLYYLNHLVQSSS